MMFYKFIILYIFTSHLVSKSQTQKVCPGASYSRHTDRRLRCGIFKTLSLNWIDCPKQCTATLNCFSINTYQSDNGTEICELVRGTKDSFEDDFESCFVESGGEHYELTSIHSCSPTDKNCEVQTRKALRDGWYQLGSSAFKYFKTKKTWKDANDICSANKASLATIDSELENRFITEVFLKTSRVPNINESMNALTYWKLDGTDKDVVLHGGALYKSAVLDLPGTAGSYATTPAAAIQSTSFSVAFWVKLRSFPTTLYVHLYSHPVNPYIFSFGIETKSQRCQPYFLAKRKSTGSDLFHTQGGNVAINTWSHIVGTWDRTTKKATVYINGTQVGQVTSAYSDLDLPNHVQPIFRVGLYQSGFVINAAMKDIIVFSEPLTSQEVEVLMKDTTAMPVRAWVGPTHSYINWAPVLQSNSTCVSLRAWEPYQQDKVPCDETMEFICEKRLE